MSIKAAEGKDAGVVELRRRAIDDEPLSAFRVFGGELLRHHAAHRRTVDCEPHLGRGEKIGDLHAISSKNRWAIKSGRRWSELTGAPTALIDAEQSVHSA